MAPTLVSNAINAGSPFASTYGNNPDVKPPDLSFTVLSQYVDDPLQLLLLALAIAGTVYLLRRERRGRRVALVTAANLVVNLAFFFTHPVATPYYTVPIALLSLWSLLFAFLLQESGAVDNGPRRGRQIPNHNSFEVVRS